MNASDEQTYLGRAQREAPFDTGFGDTIFGVVHDLGNLIQVASSALNIVSRSPDLDMGSAVGNTVTSARISLQRAGTLVQQTMRLAREGDIAVERVDVWSCLVEVEALVAATWGREIRLELYAGRELPAVICNRVGLQSAIMNLLLNARDSMPDGGVISIVATAVHANHASTEIEIRFTDTGLGMSEDVLRRASDPFFTTKMSGLGGFGLPMVKHFAQQVGGRLQLESEPGRGTTATLRLPVSIGHAPTIDLAADPGADLRR